MFHEFFAKSPLLGFPLLALVIFMVVFALVVFQVLGRRGRELEKLGGMLPLVDDDPLPARARAVPRHQEATHE